MEKRTPHYVLIEIKRLVVNAATRRITRSALEGAADLGLNAAGIVATVLELEPLHFYKSMTTHADHRIWQDVYRFSRDEDGLYIKLQIVEPLGVVISFKRL